ncbi:MAG: hypothetical protein WDN72_09235 [Alphaproteobacteria bacterium]
MQIRYLEPERTYTIDGGPAGKMVLKGKEIKWTHPYNLQVVLVHPDYIEAVKAVGPGGKVLKGAEATALGEAKLPDDIQAELAAQQAGKEKDAGK